MSLPPSPSPPISGLISESSPRLRQMLEMTPGWLWETDGNHQFTYVSANRALTMGGPNDAKGKSRLQNFRELLNHGPEIADHIEDMLHHRPFRNFVYRLERQDGRTPWICTSAEPCFDANGIFSGYQGFAMLVTPIMDAAERSIEAEKELLRRNAILEERVAERTMDLENTNRRLSDIVEGMDHGVMCFSDGPLDEQKILMANHRVAEMLEVPEDLVLPGRSRKHLHQYCYSRGDYEGTGAEDLRLMVAPTAHNRSVKVLSLLPSGRVLQSLAQHAKNGTIVMTCTDISDLKERERELEAAREAAVNADRAKSDFLANMSHEIRTPMNSVLGVAALMRSTELDDKQSGFIDVITQSGKTLLTILDDILDFSKINAGHLVLQREPFHLDDTVMDVITMMRTAADEKGLRLDARIDPDLPERFFGDMVRIRQVLTNLIGNAIKFTKTGYVRVDLGSEPHGEGRHMVTLKIIDTGIGVPKDKLDYIFENFAQVDSSLTREHKGTGLGLAICRNLVDLMGGRITAESELGKGTTISINLMLEACAVTQVPMDGCPDLDDGDTAAMSAGKVRLASR